MWLKTLFLGFKKKNVSLSNVVDKWFLLDCKIHGSHYYACMDMVKANQLKTQQILHLKRESSNQHDVNAIEIFTQKGKKLGYVPQKDNQIIANLMDQQAVVHVVITSVSSEAWDPVSIRLFLSTT